MTDSTGNDIHAAVYLAMSSFPALTAIVGDRIHDDVPHEEESTLDTSFPRIVIDGQTETEAGADDVDLNRFTITVHAYSRALGRKECQGMMHLIRQAVLGPPPGNSHPSKTGKIVLMMFDFSDGPRLEADGKTYHGTIRFRGLIQYGGN